MPGSKLMKANETTNVVNYLNNGTLEADQNPPSDKTSRFADYQVVGCTFYKNPNTGKYFMLKPTGEWYQET